MKKNLPSQNSAPLGSQQLASFTRRLVPAACAFLLSTGFLAAQPTINSVYPPVATDRAGDHVAFSVSATLSPGGGALSYNWYQGSNPTTSLSTSSSLVIANIADANAGTYYVVVADGNGTAQSTNVTLNIVDSPYLTLAPGNLIVSRVGEGSQTLSALTGNTIYLDQYTPSGTYVNSIQIPDEGTGQPYGFGSSTSASMPAGSPALLVEGAGPDATYEAMTTLSANNKQYIDLIGFCEAYPCSGTLSNSTACWRGLATVNAFGVYTIVYTNTGLYNGGNKTVHDMVTLDGTNFYTTGQAGSGTVKYINSTVAGYANGTGIPSSVGTSPNSFVSGPGGHSVQIILGALATNGFSAVSNLVYAEAGNSTNLNGLYAAVGTPQPGSNGNVTFKALLYTGSQTGNSALPVDFAFSPDNKTIYVTDARAFTATNSNLSGGIQRYDANGTGYSYSYTIQPVASATNGAQGMTVDFSANATWGPGVVGATIYATTFGASNNSLVSVTDNGPSSASTVLINAGSNEGLRGIRFSPAAFPPSVVVGAQNQTNFPNNNVTFSVNATGTLPLFYQWYYVSGGVTNLLTGANSSTFTTNNVSFASSGTYFVTVSNLTTTTVTSSASLLITRGAPTFSFGVPSYTETAGDHLSLAPVVNGSLPLSYQWYEGSTNNPLGSQTGPAYSLSSAQTTDSGTYILIASNTFGTAMSSGTLNITATPQTLSPTNLVVARIGDGVQPLSGAGNTLYLDQYTTTGAYVNTILIPDEATGNSYGTGSANSVGTTPAMLVVGGNVSPGFDAGYQAFLTRSPDGETLDFGGDAEAYPFSGTDVTVAGANFWRCVGEINGLGVYSQVYTNTGLYNLGLHQFHSAVTFDQSNYWTAGSSASASIKWITPAFQPANGNGIPAVAGSTPTLGGGAGPRVVQIVNGNVVFSDAGANPIGIYACTGLATNAAAPTTLVVAETNSPMDFAFSPDGATVYVADNGAYVSSASQLGGIQRWDTNSVSGGYSFSYTLGTGVGSTSGTRGLNADFSAHSAWGSGVLGAHLYATTADASGNRLIAITDSGSSSAATTLANSGLTNILGGVRFGPAIVALSIVSQPQNQVVLAGGTGAASFSVTAAGNGPYFYQWETNGIPIVGATNSTLAVNTNQYPLTGYTVVVSNLTQSVTSSPPVFITTVPVITFNTNGSGWAVNGTFNTGLPHFTSTPTVSNAVSLTAGIPQTSASTFFSDQVYVAGFQATWTYQVINATGSNADGMCFVIQNDPRGPAALGGTGGSLGFSSISNSVALQFHLFTNNAGPGIAFETNGVISTNNASTSPVAITNGDSINVTLRYVNGNATLTLFDPVTSSTFTTNAALNVPLIVASNYAYIGFTGADGGALSTQVVSNFQFAPLFAMNYTQAGNTLTFTWPTNVGGYAVEQNTAVNNPGNWTLSASPVSVVSGTNQASVPVGNSGNLFYRLMVP